MKIADKRPAMTFKELKPGEAFYYYDTLFMKTTCGPVSYEPFNAVSLRDGRNTWVGKDIEIIIANVHIEKDKEQL